MIVPSDKLTSFKQDLDKRFIGDSILLSMRVQRRDNILCDAIIKCGSKDFPVHRSVMYACSLYCRKLLSSSFPPKTENGMVIIDLHSFSENVVRVFLDVMYGDTGPVVNIDVEEFFKVADFLQVDSQIEVVTTIFRKMMSIENCLELYNLAGAYNFHKLSTIALTFIGDHLKEIMNSEAWRRIEESTLFTLIKHPLIRCRPDSSVGMALKSYFSEERSSDILMATDFDMMFQRKNEMCFLGELDTTVVRKHILELTDHVELYFVFNKELFYIKDTSHRGKILCKYCLHLKSFVDITAINGNLGMTPLCELTKKDDYADLMILFVPVDAGERKFSLAKLSVSDIKMVEKMSFVTTHITTTFNVNKVDIVADPINGKIYFFNGPTIHIYDIESLRFSKGNMSPNTPKVSHRTLLCLSRMCICNCV